MGLVKGSSVGSVFTRLRGVLSRGLVASGLQVAGAVLVSVGALSVSLVLGLFVAGSVLVVFGVALERGEF